MIFNRMQQKSNNSFDCKSVILLYLLCFKWPVGSSIILEIGWCDFKHFVKDFNPQQLNKTCICSNDLPNYFGLWAIKCGHKNPNIDNV